MPAFLVKHLVADHGPLMSNLKEIRKTPYSYSSKYAEATAAARGRSVYVFEVHRDKTGTTCKLGYKYRAYEAFKRAGSALWKDKFVYKNSAAPGDKAEGAYFEAPFEIVDPAFIEWFLALPPDMAEIPEHLLPALDAIFDDPDNHALSYT